MKKKLNLFFCENIINSDFFLTKQLKTVNFNLILLIKELKQFIRILIFLKRQISSKIFFSLKNEQDVFLFKNYFKEISALKISFLLDNRLSAIKLNKSEVGFLLSLSTPKNTRFLRNCINKNILLSILIDKMSFNLKNFLTYKILSEFDTLKKKLFLIAIIEKIFFKIDSKNVSALNKKIYVKNKKI